MAKNKIIPSFALFSDSTTDITAKMAEELEITILPLMFTIEGKDYRNYLDGRDMDNKTFYARIREGAVSVTTQLNASQLVDTLEPTLKKGLDVYYMAFSSGLSGTYHSACMARDELQEKYPDRKIYVTDTRCASMGEGLLVYHAAQKRLAGQSVDEVFHWVEDNKLGLCHWFTVDDLNHLKRGGRISAAAAMVGTMLGIKPVLHVDDEGHLVPVEKVRGRRKSLDALVSHMENTAMLPADQTIFISHGDCKEDAEYVAQRVREKMKVKTIFINYIGPVIGSHSGPGTVALFFLGTKR